VEWLEDRTLLTAQLLAALTPITLVPGGTVTVPGFLDPGHGADLFQITATEPGRLVAEVHAGGLPARLALLDAKGGRLIESEGQASGSPDPRLDQHLDGAAGGTGYSLEVDGLDGAAGAYTLTVAFTPAEPPFAVLPLERSQPVATVAADLNGDGIPDLVTAERLTDRLGHPIPGDLSVFLGLGDGTFRPVRDDQGLPLRPGVGVEPSAAVAYDINGDGIPDLEVANQGDDTLSVLLGNGDGTFQPQVTLPLQAAPAALATGDLNGDGLPDLAVAESLPDGTGLVLLVLGRGDLSVVPVGANPTGIVLGDFNGDGRLDIATSNFGTQGEAPSVTVLPGNGDGTFRDPVRLPLPATPGSLVAGDFNGDGVTDLATANSDFQQTDTISVFLGSRDGTFRDRGTFAAGGQGVDSLVSADFNGDGRPDLAVADGLSGEVSVLLGRGDGTFESRGLASVGGGAPFSLATADFNRDGVPDLATANTHLDPFNNLTNADVAVLLGRGDGTFPSQVPASAGNGPFALTTGDFNGDGRPDVAVANFLSDDVSVLLGQGDGTLQQQLRFGVGAGPVAVLAADFNQDGRLDLAVANEFSQDVTVLLGLGDGRFGRPQTVSLGESPVALYTEDFNGDGVPDLVVNTFAGFVVLLGRRDQAGHGDGTFAEVSDAAGNPMVFPDSHFPFSFLGVVEGDYNGDGIQDLALVDPSTSAGVVVFFGKGGGKFQPPVTVPVADSLLPQTLLTADFNHDGRADLAVATSGGGASGLSVLLGQRDGTFAQTTLPVGSPAVSLATGDFNGDGVPDLATANSVSNDVSVLLGLGDGSFVPAGAAFGPVRSSPLVADWNGDRVPDTVVLSRGGRILFRAGRADEPGTFAPPVIVNPSPGPDVPARDLAFVRRGGRLDLAALDATGGGVSFYSFDPGGGDSPFALTAGPTVPGAPPVRLAAGDLNGDGRDDLVVANAADQVFVYYQDAAGGFPAVPDVQADVGGNPSEIALADLNGDGLPDIAVTDQFSGDVSVLLNEGGSFAPAQRFRAGSGPYGLADVNGAVVVSSHEGTSGVVAGPFGGVGRPTDLVVTDSGTNRLVLVQGTGRGSFLNPAPAQTFTTGLRPTLIRAGDFNGDGLPDLAVLNQGDATVSIFLGDGGGGFTRASVPLDAGNVATGLTVADVNADGTPDLLIGNEFGDVLLLLGNGDGTFRPFQRTDRNVALAVADLNGDGQNDFVFADEARDRVAVQYSRPGLDFAQGPQDGLLAPGAVTLADLNGDGIPDLIVANTGGNNVLVYPGTADGQFGPEVNGGKGFFAGTNPAGITVDDLNGDGIPDLTVANQGSNDVSVLLGQGTGPAWTLVPGPRLQAGGAGPVGTAVADVNGDGIPDILVTNSASNTVTLLPGLGGGFFNDQSPRTFATGSDPRQLLVGNFDTSPGLDLVTLNAGSNDLTFFSNFGPGKSIPSGGNGPAAALAGDFTGNGLDDLIVANNGDGRVTLLLAGPGGPAPAETLSAEGLPHPTAVALASVGADEVGVYLAGEGVESVSLLTFDTHFGIAVAQTVGGEPPAPAGATPPGAAEVPSLPESNLAVVGTLFIREAEEPALSPAAAPGEAAPFTGFVFGLETPATPPSPDALAAVGGSEGPPGAGPNLIAAVRVLQEWAGALAGAADGAWQALGATGSCLLEEMATACHPVLAVLGWGQAALPDLRVRERLRGVLGAFYQAGLATLRELGLPLPPRPRGEAMDPPRSTPDQAVTPAPEPPEQGGEPMAPDIAVPPAPRPGRWGRRLAVDSLLAALFGTGLVHALWGGASAVFSCGKEGPHAKAPRRKEE
jgi:hypothetical protein